MHAIGISGRFWSPFQSSKNRVSRVLVDYLQSRKFELSKRVRQTPTYTLPYQTTETNLSNATAVMPETSDSARKFSAQSSFLETIRIPSLNRLIRRINCQNILSFTQTNSTTQTRIVPSNNSCHLPKFLTPQPANGSCHY
jgi:hypothetical protein